MRDPAWARPESLPLLLGAELSAVASALLFGLSTPFAKLLVGQTSPLMLAGLLYSGSGLGLWVVRLLGGEEGDQTPITREHLPWLAGAVLAGGMLGPLLLLVVLRSTPGAAASLLLNLEGVFTALIAWFIVAGGLLVSWQGGAGSSGTPFGFLVIAGACLCWALDNNLTQRLSVGDPLSLASVKGVVAGGVNLALAVALGAAWPPIPVASRALVLGLLGYGVSLTLFVLALRHLGTARTGAYFSLAPFFGATASLLVLREPFTARLALAGVLMALGVWLHLTKLTATCTSTNGWSTPTGTSRTSTMTMHSSPARRRTSHTRTCTSTSRCSTVIRTTRMSTIATTTADPASADRNRTQRRVSCPAAAGVRIAEGEVGGDPRQGDIGHRTISLHDRRLGSRCIATRLRVPVEEIYGRRKRLQRRLAGYQAEYLARHPIGARVNMPEHARKGGRGARGGSTTSWRPGKRTSPPSLSNVC